MNEDILSELLGIRCQNTCGCGNPLVEYDGEISYKDWFLTCRPFSDKYKHPQKIAIPKNSQLLKDHYVVEQIKKRIKSLKELHERGECDVLEGTDIGLLLIEELEDNLKECEFCWDSEKTEYKYDKCPKCERVL